LLYRASRPPHARTHARANPFHSSVPPVPRPLGAAAAAGRLCIHAEAGSSRRRRTSVCLVWVKLKFCPSVRPSVVPSASVSCRPLGTRDVCVNHRRAAR
jgi:hypothetical protein